MPGRDRESYGGDGRDRRERLDITVRLDPALMTMLEKLLAALGTGDTSGAARKVGDAADKVRATRESLQGTLDKDPKTAT